VAVDIMNLKSGFSIWVGFIGDEFFDEENSQNLLSRKAALHYPK
jgi:hypothetical protein